jgi:hypothetical protein
MPEYLDAGRDSGSGGSSQESDPRDFPRLLRLGIACNSKQNHYKQD